jgi:hypothetical protein
MEATMMKESGKGKPPGLWIILELWIAVLGLLFFGANPAGANQEPKNLPILQSWSGDYPVSELGRLPENQRTSSIGYLGNSTIFAGVWEAFKPGEKVPEVDFSKNLVVFSRNLDFYNRTSIGKVLLKDGVAEVLAIATLSSIPIADKVAMAMVVIPSEGVRFIQAGKGRIPVALRARSGNPLNTTYTIEGKEIRLINGYHEEQAAPGSATKIKTRVFGKPVYGDLDSDGDEDAALFLVQDSGGSGTFYYVAAALKEGGKYRGTNGVLLGDRISPQPLKIQSGVIIVDYADRRPDEPMSASPSVNKTKYLAFKNGHLEEIKPAGRVEKSK